MAAHRTVVGMVLVAGLAYGAGRYGVLADPASLAGQPEKPKQPDAKKPAPAPAQPAGQPKMTPEDEAYMKAGTPGDNHRVLDAFIGDWEGSVKIWMKPGTEPMESKGAVSRKWIMDKHFVEETVDAQSVGGPPGGQFHGMGLMGYNNLDKTYEFAWVDNESTPIMFETGSFDAKTKLFTTHGKHTDPVTGKACTTRGEMNLSNPDRQTYLGYSTGADGKEFKSFEGVFERKKK